MTVADMMAQMSWAEFRLWLDLYRHEPWPEDRKDMRNARLCAVVFQAAGVAANAEDFLPQFDYGDDEEDEDPEVNEAGINAAFRAMAIVQEASHGQ